MSDIKIYKGRGTADMREDFLDFINLVFGFNGKDTDFLKLLPKLYKEEYAPCENNYVVTENGKLKAAIGVYPRTMQVLDETLSVHGIGNVAVHPYSRSKGYMKDLMHQAVQDMIDAGADLADLGGLRQRYQYFSYEIAGTLNQFEFDSTSMRHCFGDTPLPAMRFTVIQDGEDPMLEKVKKLHSTRPMRMLRPAEQFWDIVCTWRNPLNVITEDDRFVGYFIGRLEELTLCDMEDFYPVLRNYVAQRGDVTLPVALHQTEMINASYPICSRVSMSMDQNYSVFNYRKVVNACLQLKASVQPLPDGELTVQVDGIAGKETLRIEVKDGKALVEHTNAAPQLVLEHKEAISFFFGLVSPTRTMYPVAAVWFPLPLRIDGSDHV